MGTRDSFLLPFVLLAAVFGLMIAGLIPRPVNSETPALQPDVRARLAVPPEGFLTAEIHSVLGIYRRRVLIANGRVECVQWSDAHCMPFHGTLFADGTATGTMQNGEVVRVQFLD